MAKDDLNRFKFSMGLTAFEKANASPDKKMRIGGIVSTENLDKENEIILADGLDMKPFLQKGWYNDNHSKSTLGIIGYPEEAYIVNKGDKLPDGTIAKSKGWWAEGYLLPTEKGKEVFELARSLQGTGRSLGFSVQGNVQQRDVLNKNKVVKAVVKHVAITGCPVSNDTGLQVLCKSLTRVKEEMEKALDVGNAVDNPGPSPGQGFAARTESLEGCTKNTSYKGKKKKKKKKVTKSEAVQLILEAEPNLTLRTAQSVVDRAFNVKG